ncbi:MAG TPA: MFS transporter [Terracidiphilus sp.]|nr:MFS transporter [Terracidiphilus sp.]
MSVGRFAVDVEARVAHKLRVRILPFVILLYFVSFLDRVNVGFAALSMNAAIGLTPAMLGLGGGLFFVGYIAVQVPSNLIMMRVGARAWIARVVIAWGLVSAASAFVSGPHSFYFMRFLLGITEAGFFPGTLLYLSLWFPARQRALAIAAFMAAAPLSTAVGSPISGALMELPRFLSLANWQWLFILEGLPAVVLGLLAFKVLTDRPDQAAWLTGEERIWLIETLAAERALSPAHKSSIAAALATLRDRRVLVLALIYSGTSAGLYAVGLWSPLIIHQFGFSALAIGWINAVPSVVAAVGMILWARHSDRILERSWHIAIPCMLGCVGLVWAGGAQTAVAVVLALTIVNFGSNAPKGPVWALPGMFLSGAGAAAGIAWINSLGNIGGFIGPWLIGIIKQRSGSYAGGLYAVGAMMALSAILMLVLRRQVEHVSGEAKSAR